jgi:hypothetical protein
MDGTYSTHMVNEKFIQNIGWKTERELHVHESIDPNIKVKFGEILLRL